MKQIPSSIWTLIAGVLITLISLWVGQNHGLLPEQASEQAPLVDNFFNVMVTVGTALFLVVEGVIVIFVIKYRRRAGDDTDGLPIEGSVPLEILWTAIPAIIVVGIGAYSVEVYAEMGGFVQSDGAMMAHHHSPAKGDRSPVEQMLVASAIAAPQISEPAAPGQEIAVATPTSYGLTANPKQADQTAQMMVNVTGLQYAWIFNYPDINAITGELHVPIGQDVQLNFTAQDVIHSFWIPQFRIKQDVIPGETTQLRFVATKTGEYPIVCTELCGAYHGSMRSQIIVHSPEEFTTWVEQNRVAQADSSTQAIALHPVDADAAYLSPYEQEIGVNPTVLANLQHH